MKWIHQIGDQKVRQRLRYFYLIVLLLLCIATIGANVKVKEGKEYSDFDHVALYILEYNDLPDNYVHKDLGVASGEYDVTVYDVYDNTRDPVKLPIGFTYTEAYINATIDDVGAERFVFSNNGTLYYTLNHYDSFSSITETKILGGFYLFRGTLVVFLIGGGVFVGLMFILSKEVTANDLKDDLVLDYNLLKEKSLLLRDKIKEYLNKRKQKRVSKESIEE